MNGASGTVDPSYRIAKAGLNMFTRVLAAHLKDKIIVSALHPGSVQTDMGFPTADMTAQEAAEYIFELAISKPVTGQFWYKNKQFPW